MATAGENIEDQQKAFREQNKTAFVLGYTGEVGKELVKELAKSNVFANVKLVGRREVKFEDPEIQKFEQKVIDYEKIEDYKDAFQADVGFCCLGTTRGKAGADGFYKVDHDYVMNSAKVALEQGCKHFALVSSMGANKDAWSLYTKTKGQVEEELKGMNFEQLTILRPGVLMCDREERRMGESWARFVLKPVAKLFPSAITTPTPIVAKSLINIAVMPTEDKWKTYENKAIFEAAQKK